MNRLKKTFLEYIESLKNIFLSTDDVKHKVTTESQIREISSYGNILSEGDKRILEDSLRDIDKIESIYEVNFGQLKIEKVYVNEKAAESAAIESSKTEKKVDEKEIEKN